MLAVYKVQINIERADLPENHSIGFQNGVYRFSTATLTGYYDCLDGNSFSDISQENMIIKGGELSQIGDVRIKIVSKKILYHILQNNIDLLGCKTSMSVEIDGVEKSVFEGMLVSGYSQTDEVSVEINLKDSVFANAGQVNLKVPQGFGNGSQLESSYGDVCLLRLYKQQNSGESTSQGIRRGTPGSSTPELEHVNRGFPELLTTFDGKPSFVKNFTISSIMNADTGQPAKILVGASTTSGARNPYFSGSHIEIVSGTGAGNLYRVTKVEAYSDPQFQTVTLDRPVRTGDILSRSDVRTDFLRRIPSASKKYKYINDTYFHDASDPQQYAVTQTFRKDSTDETDLEDISVFKFVDGSGRYAVPLMPRIVPLNYPDRFMSLKNVKIMDDDGTFREGGLSFEVIEINEKYCIMRLPDERDNSITLTEASKYPARWDMTQISTAFWTNKAAQCACTFPARYAPVASSLQTAVEWSKVSNNSLDGGLHVALYWRIDDLRFDGKCRIRPKFSFQMEHPFRFSARAVLIDDAGNAIVTKSYNVDLDKNGDYVEDNFTYHKNTGISLTTNSVRELPSPIGTEKAQNLLENLKNLITFDSEVEAKYIYLQLFFDAGNVTVNKKALYFSASPAECEREAKLDKIWLKGRWQNHSDLHEELRDMVGLTEQLCSAYGINTDKQSFDEASDKFRNDVIYLTPFVPFKHGEKITDKLAEICRAASFSMFSNGSTLYAKYFFSGESEWTVAPCDVIKGSLEVRAMGSDSVATEWDFSANVWGIQKTLSLDTSASFPEFAEQVSTDSSFNAELIYLDYARNGIPGFGVRVGPMDAGSLYIGKKYRMRVLRDGAEVECELTSIRRGNNSTVDALFAITQPDLRIKLSHYNDSENIEITPLAQEFNWREAVSGTLDIDIASAQELHRISGDALKKAKQKNKLEERYSKHQIAAFGTDKLWLENFISIAAHNSYAKTIVSFKVPVDRLPEGSLSSLLLRQVTLKFGRFRDNTIDGWIVGYSLAPAEDAVRIEFMNSEPMKDILFLNENLTDDQKTIDEREPIQEFYSER